MKVNNDLEDSRQIIRATESSHKSKWRKNPDEYDVYPNLDNVRWLSGDNVL